MPEEKKGDCIEEICLGHFLYGQEEKGLLMPYDLKILKQMGSGNVENWCLACTLDERNRNCPFYKPLHLHAYTVLPKEEKKE